MKRLLFPGAFAAALCFSGCSGEKPTTQLSGTVTFKGKPVPAGYINFMPDSTKKVYGEVRMVRIKDGAYATKEGNANGVFPGDAQIMISGFDGKPLDYYPDGKQIFNTWQTSGVVPTGKGTLDFQVPDSAANNLKIMPTADIPGSTGN
jgi:hypothetical protein